MQFRVIHSLQVINNRFIQDCSRRYTTWRNINTAKHTLRLITRGSQGSYWWVDRHITSVGRQVHIGESAGPYWSIGMHDAHLHWLVDRPNAHIGGRQVHIVESAGPCWLIGDWYAHCTYWGIDKSILIGRQAHAGVSSSPYRFVGPY